MGTTLTPQPPLGNAPVGIPRSLASFFQEYDLEQLNPDEDCGPIVERTWTYGDRRELRWLF